jgi:pseudaminic acid cytidylyltransferase
VSVSHGTIADAVAIIPARGGSTRIPRKNIRRFMGHPIIAYSIKTALAAGIGRVVVSTDDAEVAMYAQWYGAEIHNRAYDDGTKGTQEVTADVLRWMGNGMPEMACCVYATAPMMLPKDLIKGFDLMLSRGAPFCYSVGYAPQSMNDADAGQWYWGRSQAFLDGVSLDQATLYTVPMWRVCDINTEDDWRCAEMMYSKLKESA